MIPRTLYDAQHELFRDTVRRFLEQQAVPHHAEWEKRGYVDRGVWNEAGSAGILCPGVPPRWGGAGADFLYSSVVIEEVARLGLSGLGFALHSDIVVPYLLHYGNEDQQSRYLPSMVNGDCVTAIAMTEPGGGSDLQAIRTEAVADDGDLILNGIKTFISNGLHADVVIVAARTGTERGSDAISLLLVESGWPGFARSPPLEKVGLKAQDTCELYFNDVRVPGANLLGVAGQGFTYMMQQLPQERLVVAVAAMAVCEAAMQWTLDYVKQRKAFGKALIKMQNTRFQLAELQAGISAGRVLVDRCIELHLAGELDAATAAMVKMWTTDLQCRVVDSCLQFYGGAGYMWETPIARAWADSRVQKIYAGSNEIMKEIVARELES